MTEQELRKLLSEAYLCGANFALEQAAQIAQQHGDGVEGLRIAVKIRDLMNFPARKTKA